MQPDAEEPPIYRGDGSDKYLVNEWVEMVELYLAKKKATPKHHQKPEVLSRLFGKARDVVKVTLRSHSSLDNCQTPHVIFGILKQHFGELTFSSVPTADFYTIPLPSESEMEYWIRLNKVIDIADECLQRQGGRVEDPGQKVSMSSSPVLDNCFSFKAEEGWTTNEVQERISAYQCECRANI